MTHSPSSPRSATRAALRSGTSSLGSQTQTREAAAETTFTLRLRAERAEPEERRHIQWAEGVVDNEGTGRKSSKGTDLFQLRSARAKGLFRRLGPGADARDVQCAAYTTLHAHQTTPAARTSHRRRRRRLLLRMRTASRTRRERSRLVEQEAVRGHGTHADTSTITSPERARAEGKRGRGKRAAKKKARPNAYEKMPRGKGKGAGMEAGKR